MWARTIPQTVAGWAEWGRWLHEQQVAGIELWAGIEKPAGRVVDFLLEHGVVVYPINPRALAAARARFRTSGAKSDPFDARVAADFSALGSRASAAPAAGIGGGPGAQAPDARLPPPHAPAHARAQDAHLARRSPRHDLAHGVGGTGRCPGRWQSWQHLQAYAGTVPVTIRSGRSTAVAFRFACNTVLRTAVHQLAWLSLTQCEWAQAYDQACRDRGRRHHHALRALGAKWLKILLVMWHRQIPYDEQHHLATMTWHRLRQTALA